MKNISKKDLLIFICLIFFLVIASILPGNIKAIHTRTTIIRLKEYEKGFIKKVYLVKEDNNFSTLIQKVVSKGYKSDIGMYITINFSDNRIEDFMIVSHNESDNYGTYIEKQWFQKRFLGKSTKTELELVKMAAKVPNQVVAVTGATISSEAVVNGVNMALNNYKLIQGGLNNEKEK